MTLVIITTSQKDIVTFIINTNHTLKTDFEIY